MKRTYIVSTYNAYEWITTENAYCMLFLMIKYHFKGYRVWDWPVWIAILVYKMTGKAILKGRTATFKLFVKGTNQVTYYTPY
jgi:hypothetical protein